jgi:AhpD family alkylhydroperoxidase
VPPRRSWWPPTRHPLVIEGNKRMSKLEDISKRRRETHSDFTKLGSKGYQAYVRMAETVFQDGALPKKTKELVAIGISVVEHCEPCMQWHIEQAARCGGSLHEILEAVDVGICMGGGPACASAGFALEVMKDVFPNEFAKDR